MKKFRSQRIWVFGLVLVLVIVPCFSKTMQKGNDLVIGQVFTLSSKILGEERPIWIYLPPGYDTVRDTYPVFYLLDGDIQFHHVSGIVDFLSYFSHMPRMILVAVPNIDRERDFLPTSVDNWPPVAAADKFHAFLKEELIPHIDKQYRARPYRILCGHSYGGLFCIDAFFRDPDLFTVYISISPSLSWNNGMFVKKGAKILKNASYKNKFFFLSIAADDVDAIPFTKEFAALLDKNSPQGLEWRFDFMEHDDHVSVVHPTIYNALVWLFKGWRLSERKASEMTLTEIKGHYEKLSRRYGSTVPVPEGVLFNFGYFLLENGKAAESVEVFKYCTELYPGLPSGYVGLGEVYETLGKLELARKNYELAVKFAEKRNDTMALPVAKKLLEQLLKKIDKSRGFKKK